MGEMTSFERRVVAGLEEYVGPKRPGDAAAIARGATSRPRPVLFNWPFSPAATAAGIAVIVAIGFVAFGMLFGGNFNTLILGGPATPSSTSTPVPAAPTSPLSSPSTTSTRVPAAPTA